jgi:hypothetical protein
MIAAFAGFFHDYHGADGRHEHMPSRRQVN